MIEQITWNEYLSTLFYSLVVYYLVIVFFFYRIEISSLFNKMKSDSPHLSEPDADKNISESSKQAVDTVAEILLRNGKGANKEVLLTELRVALCRYAGMKMPAYRNAILDYVIREARQVCGVEIDVREIEG